MDMDLVILGPESETGAHVLARAVKEMQAVVGSLDQAVQRTEIANVLPDSGERLRRIAAEASALLSALAEVRHEYIAGVTGE